MTVPPTEVAGIRQQSQGGVSEQVHNDQVGDSGQAQSKSEALHRTHRHHVQHHCRQQVHGLRSEDGAGCPLPAVVHSGRDGASGTYLITNTFEVHNERVGCGTNSNN